jgi:hypothetical protein
MQDMTGRFTAALSPSSMQGGNTTADDAALVMSAPGSQSVLPVPDRMDVLPMPKFTNDTAIPVSHPGQREKVAVQSARDGSIPWKDAHDIPSPGGGWKETS